MADEERKSKRSRFDQTEPESRRASRFDRRSRSPVSRQSESWRSRSPMNRASQDVKSPSSDGRSIPADPTAAAAAAAARINAQLQAKKIQHSDTPPARSTESPTPKPSGASISTGNTDIYVSDGDYIKDIEVNDLRNRYTLTKGSTQKMIKEETGADVTTRGSYYPDKSMATAANPPLYLHVTSTSKVGLEKAIQKIDELMKQELPNLVDERRFRRREPEQFERDEFGRRKWPEERIAVNLESLPGFNLRAQVVGQGGMYVKHIQQETGCRVQIKGRGSGFKEHATQMESDEPMYLHVAGPDPAGVQKAKELCMDLLDNVRIEYEKFKANPPPQQAYGYGNGTYGQSRDRPPYSGYGYGGAQSPTAPGMSPATPAPPGTSGAPGASGSPTDWSTQYAQYYASGGQDPYAAYGGYQAYVAQYYQYYQQQQATQQIPAQTQTPPPPPSNDAPPPPPASNPPQPPPPPGAPGAGSYSAVPPPPGM